MKRSGERTQPCGEPGKVKRVADKVWFTNTLCDLLVRKSIIQSELVVEMEVGDELLSQNMRLHGVEC